MRYSRPSEIAANSGWGELRVVLPVLYRADEWIDQRKQERDKLAAETKVLQPNK